MSSYSDDLFEEIVVLLGQVETLLGLGGGGGSGTPALPFNSIQFNNAGAFGGNANLTWDSSFLELSGQLLWGAALAAGSSDFTLLDQSGTTVTHDIDGGYVIGAYTQPTVTGTGNLHGAIGNYGGIVYSGSGNLGDGLYGVIGEAIVTSPTVGSGPVYGGYFNAFVSDATVSHVYGAYVAVGGGPAVTNFYSFYSSDIAGTATNAYYLWADSRGVYRIREDNVADGSGNPQAIPALYNPRFTKYVAGAVDYERGIQQWVGNVYQIGAQSAGTGTTRVVQLVGASVNAVGNLTAANLSGTNTGDQTSVSGNAGTATALATARAINGVNFDGSTPITVPAAAGTLTGATLASGVTASSLISLGAAPALGAATATSIAAAGAFSTTQAIAAVSTDGVLLTNTTSATAGAQKWSPRLHFTGQGWKTTATAGSQTVDFIEELQPVQGAANPTANLVWSSQINGAGYNARMTFSDVGALNVTSVLSGSAFYKSSVSTGLEFSGNSLHFVSNGASVLWANAQDAIIKAAMRFGWSSTANAYDSPDVALWRDAASVLAQRDGTVAQRRRNYNTCTTVLTIGEWWKEDWRTTANQLRFGTCMGTSTGTARASSWDYGALEASPTAAITVPATSGNIVFGGGVQLSNAAATGLAAGVLAATTNATIVLYDSTGQAYRVPCII